MDKLNYEILSAIDNIETTVMEAEMNVMTSISDSYNKAINVLEYCDDNTDIDAFSVFQESKGENSKFGIPVRKKSAKEIIIDILLFIPRMIKKFCEYCIKLYHDSLAKSIARSRIDNLRRMGIDDADMDEHLLKKLTTVDNVPLSFGILRYEYEWYDMGNNVKISSAKISLNDDNPFVRKIKQLFDKNKKKIRQTKESVNETIVVEVDENRKTIEIEFQSFFNVALYYKGLSMNICKIIESINVDRFLKDDEYNKDLYYKIYGIMHENNKPDLPSPEKHRMKIGKCREYIDSCKNGFDDVMNSFNKCQNKLSTIAEAIKKNNNDTQIDNNSNAMKAVVAMQDVFTKITNELKPTIENFEQSVERINAVIDSSFGDQNKKAA